MNGIDIKHKTIQKYKLPTIIAHWIMIISVFGLMVTGTIPMINEVISYLNIADIEFSTVPYSSTIHILLGFLLIFGILFVIFTRTVDFRDIVSGRFRKNFGSFFRSIMYIVGFEKRLESGDIKKFYGYQKMSFIITTFALWTLIFSGFILFVNSGPDSSINQTFIGSVHTLHLIGSLIIIFIIAFHIIITIRRFDRTSLHCIFIDGKLPLWYIKKNHKLWYDEIINYRR